MGKKRKVGCSKNSDCCKVEDVKLERQVLPWINTVRVPRLGDVPEAMADNYKALNLAIKDEVQAGIQFLVSQVPEQYRQSLSLSNHHTIQDIEEATLLTVTVVAMWLGTEVPDTSKPKEKQHERRTAAPKGGEAVSRRERRLLDESEFPAEVQAAAAQIRGTFAQPGNQEGNQEEDGQGGKARSQQTFEVKSEERHTGQAEPVREEPKPTSSLPPSDSNTGQAPSLGGVFDD